MVGSKYKGGEGSKIWRGAVKYGGEAIKWVAGSVQLTFDGSKR